MMESDMLPQDMQQLHQQLLDYCERGCLDSIRSLLSGLPPDTATDFVNTLGPYFGQFLYIYLHTPLAIAAMSGHSQVVQLLVEDYKADVNKASSASNDSYDGMTPLILAASEGHLKVVDILIQAGCNVNASSNCSETALFHACFRRQCEVVEHLIQNSADINLPNDKGTTCLLVALNLAHKQLATILLEGGADPNAEIKISMNKRTGKRNYVAASNCRMSSRSIDTSPLDELYKFPSSFDLENRTTALHWAVQNHQPSAVTLLLSYGATMFRDEDGFSPLDLAFSHGYLDIVEILAGSCALSREEKIYSWEGLALLHESLSDSLRFLQHASEEREKDSSPSLYYLDLANTPFRFGMQQFVKRFQELLEEGRTLPFSHVTEVLDYCILRAEDEKRCEIPQEDVDELIALCLVAFFFGLNAAQDQEEERELQQLARRFVCLNPLCGNGGSLLHVLATGLWQTWSFLPADLPIDRLLALLLNSGASVHAKDNYGNRPLHEIARCSHELEGCELLASVTRTLVEAGALVGVQNNAGLTPLKCAATTIVREILRPDYPPSLQSLAATEIMKNKIPFEDEIPRILHAFVELH